MPMAGRILNVPGVMEQTLLTKTRKIFQACGMAAPAVYVLAVVIGGVLTPGYDHVSQDISALMGSGAPNKAVLDPLFVVHNILLCAFGIGLRIRLGAGGNGKDVGRAGAGLIVVVGGLGLAMTLFFPRDAVGVEPTFEGTMHVMLAGLITLGAIFAMLLVGLFLHKMLHLRGYAWYSFVTDAVVLVSGIWTLNEVVNRSVLLGLAERITIGAFLLWVFVIALKIYAPRKLTDIA